MVFTCHSIHFCRTKTLANHSSDSLDDIVSNVLEMLILNKFFLTGKLDGHDRGLCCPISENTQRVFLKLFLKILNQVFNLLLFYLQNKTYTYVRDFIFFLFKCTLSAKDRGPTKNPAVDLGTNFDASTFYQDVSSVLSISTEYRTQLFSSRPYFTQNMVDQKC